jgi:uncharacterized protein
MHPPAVKHNFPASVPSLREDAKSLDVKTLILVLTALVSLVCTYYFGIRPGYRLLIQLLSSIHLAGPSHALQAWIESTGNVRIHLLFYWMCVVAAFYIVVPALCIKLLLRERLVDYGLGVKGLVRHWKIYAVMMAIMAPVIIGASSTSAFQHTYPFYRLSPGEPLWPFFWLWEAIYLGQFVGIEFFFRGFLVHGLKRKFGIHAVIIMLLPYCMIHFGKPIAETFGAIAAGLILGYLSYRTRTIWMGVALHFSIALCMDLAALWHLGRL